MSKDESCGPAQGTRLYTGGYAEECRGCGTPLLTDEEDRGTCDDCAETPRGLDDDLEVDDDKEDTDDEDPNVDGLWTCPKHGRMHSPWCMACGAIEDGT